MSPSKTEHANLAAGSGSALATTPVDPDALEIAQSICLRVSEIADNDLEFDATPSDFLRMLGARIAKLNVK